MCVCVCVCPLPHHISERDRCENYNIIILKNSRLFRELICCEREIGRLRETEGKREKGEIEEERVKDKE